jgi:hypothetical protein
MHEIFLNFPWEWEPGTRGLRNESQFFRLLNLLTQYTPTGVAWPPAVNLLFSRLFMLA